MKPEILIKVIRSEGLAKHTCDIPKQATILFKTATHPSSYLSGVSDRCLWCLSILSLSMFHASSLEAHFQSISATKDHIGHPTASQSPPCGAMAETLGTICMLMGNKVLWSAHFGTPNLLFFCWLVSLSNSRLLLHLKSEGGLYFTQFLSNHFYFVQWRSCNYYFWSSWNETEASGLPVAVSLQSERKQAAANSKKCS